MPRTSISYRIRSRRFYVEGSADECWEWTGTRSPQGYGQIRGDHNGPVIGAHRAVYEDRVGPIPDGLHLDHLCRNRPCVNPGHLEPVTPLENQRRGVAAPRIECPQGHSYAEHGYPIPGVKGRGCRKCDTARARRWVLAHPKPIARCGVCGAEKPIMAKALCNGCYLKARRAIRGRSDRPTRPATP